MIRKYVRVRDRNQITVPAEILEGLGVGVGDFLEISRTRDNLIRLRPTEMVIMNTEMSDREEDQALAAKPTTAERLANTAEVERIVGTGEQGEAAQFEKAGDIVEKVRDLVRAGLEQAERQHIELVLNRTKAKVRARAAASQKHAVSEPDRAVES